jgi:hypothetical protein
MDHQDHRTEGAVLGIIRRLQGGFEPHAAANARLRQAIKRLEAAPDAFEGSGVKARPQHLRRAN